MAKQSINVGTTANDKKGDSLRAAFVKVNANFTELYAALGLTDVTLNLGAFTFTGSTMSTDDSTNIVIDKPITVNGEITVDGDITPKTNLGASLGTPTKQFKSLYVSNNTIYIGGTAVGVDANGALTTGGTVVGSTPAWANITGKPTIPTSFDRIVNGANTVSLDANGNLTFPQGTLLGYSDPGGFIINGAVDKDIAIYTYNGADAHGWTFGTDGSLTLPGDIKSDGNINIEVNLTDSTKYIWQFGEDGALTLPGGSTIAEVGPFGVLQITPRGGANIYQALMIYPWATAEGDQIHLASGDPTTVDLYLGDNDQYVKIEKNGGDVVIGTNTNTKQWTFGTDGGLTFPDSTVQSTAYDPSNIRSEGNINIDINLTDSTRRTWQFGEDGNLETPGGIQVAGILKIDNGVHEKFQTKADATGIVTHDCSLGHIFYHTSPDALFTVNFTNLNLTSGYATALTLIIEQGGTGFIPNSVGIGGVIQTLNWQGNVTPTPSINRTDVVTFSIICTALNTYTVLGQLTGF